MNRTLSLQFRKKSNKRRIGKRQVWLEIPIKYFLSIEQVLMQNYKN